MQGSCISHVFSKTCFCATINEFLKNDSYDVSIKFILVFQNISDELGWKCKKKTTLVNKKTSICQLWNVFTKVKHPFEDNVRSYNSSLLTPCVFFIVIHYLIYGLKSNNFTLLTSFQIWSTSFINHCKFRKSLFDIIVNKEGVKLLVVFPHFYHEMLKNMWTFYLEQFEQVFWFTHKTIHCWIMP